MDEQGKLVRSRCYRLIVVSLTLYFPLVRNDSGSCLFEWMLPKAKLQSTLYKYLNENWVRENTQISEIILPGPVILSF